MNYHAIKAIYRFEMARMFRTVVQLSLIHISEPTRLC